MQLGGGPQKDLKRKGEPHRAATMSCGTGRPEALGLHSRALGKHL